MNQMVEQKAFIDRLEKVERQNQRLNIVGIAILIITCVVFVLVISRALQPRTLEADKFVLRDADGRQRATLGMTQRGPQLALFGADEDLLVRLEALDDSSHLVFHSRLPGWTSLAPAFLGVGDRGKEETGFLQLVAYDSNSSTANCYFILEPREDVKGMRFYDMNGEGRVSMSATERGLQMRLVDANGITTWQAPSLPEKVSNVVMK